MSQLLLHIGFPKSGSTYLQKWFEKNPSVYYQPKYMAQGFLNAWELAKYAQFSPSPPQSYVLSCEDLTLFQSERDLVGLRDTYDFNHRRYQENVCEMLHQLFPTAKILIVTRSYKTIFQSIYSQYLAMAGSLEPEAFIKANHALFSSMLDYTYVINLYREKFGKDRVIVMPYELMRDNLAEFLSLIENELDIQEKFNFTDKKINAAYDIKVLTAYQRLSNFVCQLIKPLPRFVQESIYKKYAAIVRNDKPHALLLFMSKFVTNPIDLNKVSGMADFMKDKAEVLRTEKLYESFLNEYQLS